MGLNAVKGVEIGAGFASVAANLGERREATRWISVSGRRKALKITAEPLDGGGVAVWTADVTQAEEIQDALKRHVAAHDETLNHIAEAVAIFGPTRRLSFHNTAFADLWGLETAWLAERPTHGEILDRLRQRQRLPETPDYARWKAAELARYETLGPQPDDRWTLPDGRTLRLIRQPHPMGGLLLLYSDITGEVRLRAAIRRHVRHRERDELVAIGRKLYEEVAARMPGKIGKKALTAAVNRLKLEDEEELMHRIGLGKINDRALMEALVPGFDADGIALDFPSQERAISIRGLTPGVGYQL
eukprot:gene11771-15705_t